MRYFTRIRSQIVASCCALVCATLISSPAKSEEPDMAPSCAETWLSQNRRVSMHDALSCINTWACAHANNSASAVTDVIGFEACREISLDARTETKDRDARLATELENAGLSAEEFWSTFGIRPQALARCAIATKTLLESRGHLAAWFANAEVTKACMMPRLAPDTVAELARLGVQYQ